MGLANRRAARYRGALAGLVSTMSRNEGALSSPASEPLKRDDIKFDSLNY
jgi:hypothetical protein